MKLTEEVKQSLLCRLAESPLKTGAFDYDFDSVDGTLVSINVRGQEHFYYTLHSSEFEGKPWEVRESPGGLFHGAETIRFGNLKEAIAYVGDWLGRVEAQVEARSEEPPVNP